LQRNETLAVLFLASWCSFCRRFLPAFEAAAKASSIPWAYADVSELENVFWDAFNIEVVPTIIVFKDGKPKFRKDGVRGRGLSEDAIKETIDQVRLLEAAN